MTQPLILVLIFYLIWKLSKKIFQLSEPEKITLKFNRDIVNRSKMNLSSLKMIVNDKQASYSSKELLLNVRNGLFECTAPVGGIYKIELESRSTSTSGSIAKGVNIKIELKLRKHEKLFFFICDTVFLFDSKKELIAVPGSAGLYGNESSSGSIRTDNSFSQYFSIRLSRYSEEFFGYGKINSCRPLNG